MIWTSTQQENLLILIQRRGERLALEQQFASLKKTLDQQRTQQATLRDRWDDEQTDVDRLERLSWATIYYNLLSRHDQQLTKEKEEAQRARLEYEAQSASVEGLAQQVEKLQTNLSTYADVEEAYEMLIRNKEAAIQEQRDLTYEEHATRLTAAQQHLTEVAEAQLAGQETNEEVNQLISLLNEAHSLGNWDMFSNSSLLSAMKYSKLDDVRDQSILVRRSVQRFGSELADVHHQLRGEWTFDNGWTRFVDIFFDNIFTDMAVQRRIEQAQHNADQLYEQVMDMLANLTGQHEQALVEQTRRSHELRSYLEQAR